MKDNSYSNSLVFLEGEDGFVSIAHTAYPTEKARVRTIRDSLVRNLKRSEGFKAPVSMKRRENVQKFKLNVPEVKEEVKEQTPDLVEELETIIIQ